MRTGPTLGFETGSTLDLDGKRYCNLHIVKARLVVLLIGFFPVGGRGDAAELEIHRPLGIVEIGIARKRRAGSR